MQTGERSSWGVYLLRGGGRRLWISLVLVALSGLLYSVLFVVPRTELTGMKIHRVRGVIETATVCVNTMYFAWFWLLCVSIEFCMYPQGSIPLYSD